MDLQEICHEQIPIFIFNFKPTDRRDGVFDESFVFKHRKKQDIAQYMAPTGTRVYFKHSNPIIGLYSKPKDPIDDIIRRIELSKESYLPHHLD